jgi:hypothetical protein
MNMDRLPQVMQKEIWEYVHGDRKYWQQRQFRLVLAELSTSNSQHLLTARRLKYNQAKRTVRTRFRVARIELQWGWFPGWDHAMWRMTFWKKRFQSESFFFEDVMFDQVRKMYRQFVILAAEIECGFQKL